MVCDKYILDTTAIDKDLKKIRDKATKELIKNKINQIKSQPHRPEHKKGKLKNYNVVKIDGQRLIMVYIIDEDLCQIIIVDLGKHDDVYKRTF
jgi:addiction module RelE/StbE family toxin